MASLYKLPCIFVVENNLWAIGMQHNRATNPTAGDDSPYIYKKGPAFGMPGILVDGMDVRKVTLTGLEDSVICSVDRGQAGCHRTLMYYKYWLLVGREVLVDVSVRSMMARWYIAKNKMPSVT